MKRFDPDGHLVGECVFCGLLTSTAYTRSVRAIPYLRRKVDRVISRAGFDPASHSGKALVNVLEHYPRDDLFQIDEDTLYQFAMAIMQLDERPRVRVLPRRDRFDRFVSVLVYIPRDRYDSRIRAKIGDYLATAFQGRLRAFYPFFPEGQMVRVHFIIGRYEGETPHVDRATLETRGRSHRAQLDRCARRCACGRTPAAARRGRCWRAIARPSRSTIARSIAAPLALSDIAVIETLTAEHPLGVELYRDAGAGACRRRPESVEPQPSDPALRARAGAGEYGLSRRRRAHLSHQAARGRRCVVPRHDARKRAWAGRWISMRSKTACRIASSR